MFGLCALYLMYYPQLVAAPIERPHNIFPQLVRPATFDRVGSGLRWMMYGFFLKIAIADSLANYGDLVYENPRHYGASAVTRGACQRIAQRGRCSSFMPLQIAARLQVITRGKVNGRAVP